MKNKLCCVIMVMVLLICTIASPVYASVNSFTDISHHWAKENILWAQENGLVSGTSPTTFSPNEKITRGMYITILYRLAGSPTVGEIKEKFTDVSPKDYFYNAVHWGMNNNLIRKSGSERFAPNGYITRLEIAESLHNYWFYDYKIKNPNAPYVSFNYPEYPPQYTDTADISDSRAMKWAVGIEGIITGRTKTTLSPHEGATRAEAMVIFHRFIN